MLPYTAEVFFSLMARYNAAMGVGIAAAVLLALAAVGMAATRRPAWCDRAIAVILAVGWAWSGAVFHYQYFAPFNFMAPIYAGFFGVQALLLAVLVAGLRRVAFRFAHDAGGVLGGIGLALALIGLPAAGWLDGVALQATPVVGLAPDPTALVTLGMLALARPRVPVSLLAIPLAWALISGWMSWVLGIESGYLPPAMALAVLALAVWQRIGPAPR